jgi:hypothetical protein
VPAQTTRDGTHCIHFPGTIRGEIVRCARLLPPGHPLAATTLVLSLFGEAPNRIAHIALTLDGQRTLQLLSVEAAPPVGPVDAGLWFADMNFDGLVDIGLMTSPGADSAYLWFLFDRETNAFALSPALSALRAPRPVPARRRIIAGVGGSDLYRWQGDELRLEERVERTCSGGACTCRRLRPARHGLSFGQKGPCG